MHICIGFKIEWCIKHSSIYVKDNVLKFFYFCILFVIFGIFIDNHGFFKFLEMYLYRFYLKKPVRNEFMLKYCYFLEFDTYLCVWTKFLEYVDITKEIGLRKFKVKLDRSSWTKIVYESQFKR